MSAGNDARIRTILLLWSIAETYEKKGLLTESATIAYLATALNDLEAGRLDPILVPAKLENKRPDPHSLWRSRLLAVGAFEILQRAEINRAEAARKTVRMFPNFGALRSGRKAGSDAQALESWVNRLRQARELPTDVTTLYQSQRDAIDAAPRLTTSQAIDAAKRLIETGPLTGVVFPRA